MLPDLDGDGRAELYVNVLEYRETFVVWGRNDGETVRLDHRVADGALRVVGAVECGAAVDIDGDSLLDLDCRVERDRFLLRGTGEREREIDMAHTIEIGRSVPFPGLRTTPVFDPLEFRTELHQWLGDVNADGRVDLWLEQRSTGSNEQYAVTFEVLLSTTDGLVPESPRFELDVRHAYARPIGDFNGDGVDDFAMYIDCPDPREGPDQGCATVRVVFGGPGLASGDLSNWPGLTIAPAAGLGVHALGYSIGDVTGDGLDDLLVKTISNDTDATWLERRHTVLFPGSSEPRDMSLTDAVETGIRLHGDAEMIGDLDGDGRSELRLDAWTHEETAIVWGREPADDVTWADVEAERGGILLPSPIERDRSMTWLSGEDVTGDGVPDLAFVAPKYDHPNRDAGVVVVLSGAAIGALR
jgi:hypothetical protein